MASFAGDGIVTKIDFRKDDAPFYWGKFLSKEEILEMVSKRIDMNLYEIRDYSDGFVLLLKPELINEHLNDFLKEIRSVNPLALRWITRKHYLYLNSFDVTESDIKIKVNKNLEYELYANNKLIQKEQDITTDLYNDVYCPDFNSPTGYIVNVSLICLGREYDEVISEDNTYPLFLMNMNLKRFKSPISTVFVYGFIDD